MVAFFFLSLLFSWNDTDRPRASFHWHSAESCVEKKETSNSLDEARYVQFGQQNNVLLHFVSTKQIRTESYKNNICSTIVEDKTMTFCHPVTYLTIS